MKKITCIFLALMLTLTTITGCSSTAPSTAPSNTPEESSTPAETSAYDKEVDFLVIGGGGAGLAAAIEAHDNGIKI